ncbi:cupin domain-containing protein [Jiella mangrovi]|uniref:Cupin domain-containing protein n=1 Tax=Jiella mangrovi TaxID=2821407 RepID=A0ABS4BEA7_9HYPH|nr:cupin domain-containing protein [Jiella mangrovi]MBP0615083.1 cupin domain-containing protein [Jiella mangrovi]
MTSETANASKITIDMADMPVQLPCDPGSAAQGRARFFNSGNAFNLKLAAVPAAAFREEATAALALEATGFTLCDQSAVIGSPFPATTPLMLARYAAIRPDERLDADFNATGAIWYVMAGAATASTAGEKLSIAAGDVVLTPGGGKVSLEAGSHGAVLWVVTNEPQLAFEGARPDPSLMAPPVHYPAAEIERQLERVVEASTNATTSGIALIFSTKEQEARRNILPSLTLSLNTVPAGEQQRAHRHNSAAVTLILKGEAAYSKVADARCEWSPFATLVTPAGDPHSHHNDGADRAAFLIVQDGGLHYHARTMGFAFMEPLA